MFVKSYLKLRPLNLSKILNILYVISFFWFIYILLTLNAQIKSGSFNIASFDTMKYYREKGSIDFPSVTMLARIHFGRLDNGGFQERMFSTASLAMAKEQNRMDFDLLEMRTLLAQNKELIEKKII